MKAVSREHARLQEARMKAVPWRKWGPYLSERQWGTVREDYSRNGEPWNYFTYDQARSSAYRWGEDGLAGFSDDAMQLCFALALWNEKDPALKERLFGLNDIQGNHGEDAKEYYFYLDCTPTASYAKMLYKYPHAAFPYAHLISVNRARTRQQREYELLDTGVFDENRYFDVFVEYAKAAPEDILIRVSVVNRGPEPAQLHVLPHLWFRNTWWENFDEPMPSVTGATHPDHNLLLVAKHRDLGERRLYGERARDVLFTNNETNLDRVFGISNRTSFVKDGINDYLVLGQREAVNPERTGTKAAVHYVIALDPGATNVIRLRLKDAASESRNGLLGPSFDKIFADRQAEADEFYATVIPPSTDPEKAQIMRQAFAGMLWSRQTYIYEVNRWLKEHGADLSGENPVPIRNSHWSHMAMRDVICVPDKWEYPWSCTWNMAFHTLPLALVDSDFAVQQLELMLRERYLHPNGQFPAHEGNFDEVDPPVHAWATLFNFRLARESLGERAMDILRGSFPRLLLNFAWWANRKDSHGRNVFEGGYLDLDNVGMFDRTAPLPKGGRLEQPDGTAWMAFFAQNMLDISLELALRDPVYESLAVRFYEHFILIASAMSCLGEARDSMWDEEDGFYYSILRMPDGTTTRLKVRSMVGLLPLCAVTVYPREVVLRLHEFSARIHWFNQHRPDLLVGINPPRRPGVNGRYMLATLNEKRLRRVLARLLDPNEFLSDYGIRSLSRYHLDHPCVFQVDGTEYRLKYTPGESDVAAVGNSNWRGPIWMPENALILRALLQMYGYYGNEFKVECPTGSGNWMTLFEVARELAGRLTRIFLRNKHGKRPVYGESAKFQDDPHWRDHLLFYEYFHGDNGTGLGASHQTGWTGLIASFIYLFETLDPDRVLAEGFSSVVGAMRSGVNAEAASAPLVKTVRREPDVQPKKRSPRRVSSSALPPTKPRSQRLHKGRS